MILVTITINSTDHQISVEDLALETFWDAKIISAGNLSESMKQDYGGYVEPSFGNFTLMPDLFDGTDWKPPQVCPVKIEYTATTEAAAIELFSGSGYLESFDRNAVIYALAMPEYDSYIADSTAISGTLNAVFTTYCGASYLDLTLDTTYARATSPAVSFTTSSRKLTLEVLSEIAAFFTHLFYIKGSTLYLVDMKLNNGTESIDEFQLSNAVYGSHAPHSGFSAGSNTLDGTNAIGDVLDVAPVCHGTSANIDAALADIKTIMERPVIDLDKPIPTSGLPVPGLRLDWTDESTYEDTVAQMWVRDIVYDLNTEMVTISGDGAIT